MDYEESETPYFAVGSLERAEKMRDKMIDGLKRLNKSIQKLDFDDPDWQEKHLKNIEILKNHKWIYSVNLSCDLSEDIDSTCVDIQTLPYYE